MDEPVRFQQILGIRFLIGNAQTVVDQVFRDRGLVVVPSAPGLRTLPFDKLYRDALLGADFAITDSMLMVLLWNLLQADSVPRISGLSYMRALIKRTEFCEAGKSFWVMPRAASARRNSDWLNANGVQVSESDIYVAPMYGSVVADPELLSRLRERRPPHVVLCVGSGTQEPLGFYLKQHLDYTSAIHCVGAAIAFLTGDQVGIPIWVDRSGLGWLWRVFSNPSRYGPRYWEALHLVSLLLRYRDRIPIPSA
jgi:UDP-N-acetyl-D-mannosaminuronic acid transferase (WecB/TagA/CpsF family)